MKVSRQDRRGTSVRGAIMALNNPGTQLRFRPLSQYEVPVAMKGKIYRNTSGTALQYFDNVVHASDHLGPVVLLLLEGVKDLSWELLPLARHNPTHGIPRSIIIVALFSRPS